MLRGAWFGGGGQVVTGWGQGRFCFYPAGAGSCPICSALPGDAPFAPCQAEALAGIRHDSAANTPSSPAGGTGCRAGAAPLQWGCDSGVSAGSGSGGPTWASCSGAGRSPGPWACCGGWICSPWSSSASGRPGSRRPGRSCVPSSAEFARRRSFWSIPAAGNGPVGPGGGLFPALGTLPTQTVYK